MSARSANLAFHFNSRPSARGDSKVTALYNKREVFQFTPLREGRPCRTRHPRLVSISIHAPPRGATDRPCRLAHALLFQFTPLREGRRNTIQSGVRDILISIHAPPRGATQIAARASAFGTFQFTPLREGRQNRHVRVPARYAFQFTPLREGRLAHSAKIAMYCRISIHAPPRGATRRNG